MQGGKVKNSKIKKPQSLRSLLNPVSLFWGKEKARACLVLQIAASEGFEIVFLGCLYAVNYFIACWGFWRWEGCVVYTLWNDCKQFPREYSISEISANLISCECLHMLCGIVPVPGLNERNNFGSLHFAKYWWWLQDTRFPHLYLPKSEQQFMLTVEWDDI